jgi:hypothetical protein
MKSIKNNQMKKFIVILLAVIFAGSCKDFLEEKQVSTLVPEYYNTEVGLEALIKGLYVYARTKNEWDANGVKLNEPETDAYQTSSVSAAKATANDYGSDISVIAGNVNNYIGGANATNAPMGAYPQINNCNIALEQLENVKPGKFGTDPAYNTLRKAEVLFLRAWAYYLITNQLGDVPLVLTSRRLDNNSDYYFPKETMEKIYKQIIADVRFAYNNLPASQTEQGRVTKWAAGHFLAKLYLNRAQASGFQGNSETHLQMLYKGNVPTDLDSVVSLTTEVINGVGGVGALATDYWTLFNPAVSETSPSKEVIWAAQFDVNTSLDGRFGNRDVNYHIGDYTNQTGVTRSMAYGRPFGEFKPSDWGYDNFRDKVNDSRYYKTFAYEYISNMPASTSTSYTWDATSAAYWNKIKPAGAPTVKDKDKRIVQGARALIYLENQPSEALDSAKVRNLPYQFIVRWVKSATTGKLYYRLFIDGTDMGLATARSAPYLSARKFVDPTRGGSTAEANFNSETGTRDFILMRLAETYLIRAEAYGRKGNYTSAVADINVIRQRAAYKAGESRPSPLVEWEPQAATLTPAEKTAPFPAAGTSFNAIKVTENHFTPGTPEALAEKYIPTVTSKPDMFIHFIYNEKAREFLSEGLAWEDLHNAGILYERVVYLNQMASDKAGLWPVAANTALGNGQDGNGKGVYIKEYTFRPWPNIYLSLLTDQSGNPLDAGGRQEYQNPGYK